MEIDITIKNYRCFPDSKPAHIRLRDGFTAFVGVNNSGKSTLLKMFFEFRDIFGHLLTEPAFVSNLQNTPAFGLPPSVSDKKEFFHNGNDRDITIDLRLVNDLPDNEHHKSVLIRIPHNTSTFRAFLPELDGITLADKLHLGENGKLTIERRSQPGQTTTRPGPGRSITALCEAMAIMQRCIYIGAFRNAINVGTKTDYFDIQIGQAFIQRWRQYKTGGTKQHNELAYRVTQNIEHIFGIGRLEINPTVDDQSLQLFIDGESFKLAELGAGIAQFIIVLANAAIRQPTFVLIDEPELNLHPSLQLDFLTSIGSFASNGVVFSTHNIGLARASAERVYSVRKSDGQAEVRDLESTPNLAEFLGELSFSGYKELGYDKILLVEGPTEVKAVQQLLRLYRKDHKVVLLPLGGSSMINERSEAELQEVKRISSNVAALVDSERASASDDIPEDRKQFKKKCDEAGIDCHILDRRAFENYFPDHAIKKALGEKYAALRDFDVLKDAKQPWGKRDNWRIAREMLVADLDKTDLGKFLAEV
jgi:ABC-type cobalamin/Fe3+-siderophores transport system ATPase subunit